MASYHEIPSAGAGGAIRIYPRISWSRLVLTRPQRQLRIRIDPRRMTARDPRVAQLITELENCLGAEAVVTSAHEPEGRTPGDAHSRGDAVDMDIRKIQLGLYVALRV